MSIATSPAHHAIPAIPISISGTVRNTELATTTTEQAGNHTIYTGNINPPVQIDPLILLECQEPEVFRNKKILVVDDLPFATDRAKNILSKNFKEQNGCSIETVNDPERAIEMIRSAHDNGNPYDVLVTDLFMQKHLGEDIFGINGDELLRRLGDENLFLRTVVFSGSWAHDLKENLFSQIDTARCREEIYSIVNNTSNSLDGIPLVQVDKYGFDTEKTLTYSVIGVLLMGKRADNTAIQNFLSSFRPKTQENSPSKEILSKAIEIYRNYREFLVEVKKDLEERTPNKAELKEIYSYDLITTFLNRNEDCHLNELGGSSSDQTRSFFHNVTPVMHEIYTNSLTFMISNDIENKLESFYRAFNSLAISTKKTQIRAFNFNPLIKNVLQLTPQKIIFESSLRDELTLSSNGYLVQEITSQPISNAIKAIRNNPNGTIKLSIKEVGKADIPISLDGDRFIEVCVEDNGCGMPPEKVQEINERRCKEGDSTFGTFGWGMPMLQEMTKTIGAGYMVESEVDIGTRFKLYFKVT